MNPYLKTGDFSDKVGFSSSLICPTRPDKVTFPPFCFSIGILNQAQAPAWQFVQPFLH